MANLYSIPLTNAVQRSLGNTLNQGETATITFSTSVSSVLQATSGMPGILVIDRVDVNGTATPSLTEYISYTGVSGSTVTGLTRGLAGTSDIAHSIGSIVEFVPDITWAQAINDVITTEHDADGNHKVNTFSNLNAPEGFLINGKIVPSVASNNLTVALKTLAGTDATASNPIYVRINDNLRTITGALSITLNAGTNWFDSGSASLATQEVDYFVYLGDDAGVVRIGFGRIPYAKRFEDYSATTTSDKHIAFNTALVSNEAVTVIGRFVATLSASASHNWSVPTFTATNLIQKPIYDTRELSWTPQYTGFSTAPSAVTAKYKIRDDFVRCFLYETVNGTSNSTSKTVTFPINSKGGFYGAILNTIDNGTQGYGKLLITSATNTPAVYPNLTSANWTASGNARIETMGVTIEYGI